MRHLAFLLLAACGPQVEIKLPTQYVDINPKWRDATVKALEALNAEGVLYHYDTGAGEQPGEGEQVIHIIAEPWQTWGPEGGTAFNNGGNIHLNEHIGPFWGHLPITIIHELGHIRGLYHSKDKNNVMYRSSQNVVDVDVAAQQVRDACRDLQQGKRNDE